MSKGSGSARELPKSQFPGKKGKPIKPNGTPPKEIAVNPDSKKTRAEIIAEQDRQLR
jgi:hypothetical protein